MLHRYPHLSAILFEHPNVIDRVTNKWLTSSDSSHNAFNLNGRIWQNRTNVSSGDYFVPSDIPIVKQSAIYIMKQILHELDDDKSLMLLRNIYNAMVQCDNCRLLVIEHIIKRCVVLFITWCFIR